MGRMMHTHDWIPKGKRIDPFVRASAAIAAVDVQDTCAKCGSFRGFDGKYTVYTANRDTVTWSRQRPDCEEKDKDMGSTFLVVWTVRNGKKVTTRVAVVHAESEEDAMSSFGLPWTCATVQRIENKNMVTVYEGTEA